MNQEYPVVLLQCRGLDDPALPADQAAHAGDLLDRRSRQPALAGRPTESAGRLAPRRRTPPTPDRAAGAAPSPFPRGELPRRRPHVSRTPPHAVRRREGHASTACDGRDDAARGGRRLGLPACRDGRLHRRRRQRRRPVRGALRRRERVARVQPTRRRCSIVVIPIVGISCDRPRPDDDSRKACRKTGRFAARARATSPTGRRPRGLARLLVVGVELAQPVLDADHLRPAARRLRRPRPACAHRLLRLRADAPRRPCSGRRRTAWTRSASSSSSTRCPTQAGVRT